ncbi:signal peptidase I [Paenibacillus rhizophilus]|uniref:Signal peptidase I n=1 Tax=Paenibacillus rhizophilus TaxID=1850366 RepID=A0A3N9Q6H6_9BACL|nr:signal peptidase I [Paenibacillus rhizophilus]RQW13106.1 signal peptidase I [Paenibacillus rhizophilus]
MQQDLHQGQDEGDDQARQSPPKQKNEVLEWVKAIAIALILVILIRWLLFKPFIVDGPSMQPNFHTGERVIVNEILYDIRSPQRGEVIVFHVPSEGRDFIKRVIGVAGDTVKVEGDVVTVNGKKVDETYIQKAIDQAHANNQLYNDKNFPNEDFKEGTVPKGHVFVMGDNRSDSTDSRMIGYVPLGDIVGRADVIFWPVSDMEWIKH